MGALAWLGPFQILGSLPVSRACAATTGALALILVAFGLVSSVFHLRRPERAWRALSQWRSSWLSREGVAALATFPPAVLFLGLWVAWGSSAPGLVVAGVVTTLLASATIWFTAMIYRSLWTIPQWSSRWTVPGFLAMALASGGLIICATALFFENVVSPAPVALTSLALIASACVKAGAWKTAPHTQYTTAASALGLEGRARAARLLEGPSTSETWVQHEMVFAVARRHVWKLRRLALALGFATPLLLLLSGVAMGGIPGVGLAILAVCSNLAGTMIERWLFFAEARHKVALYFGDGSV